MTQEQLQEQNQQVEISDKTVDFDEMVKALYGRVEELVETVDPARFDDILTNVLITQKPEKADIYGEDERVNGKRPQIFDSFYSGYIDWKWSMFIASQRNTMSLRKKDVMVAIDEMDKLGGNSATFNRFVWVALGREVMKAVGSNKQITQAEKDNKLGQQLISDGQYEEALNHFDQAIQSNRQFCMPLVNKGIALVNLERSREAVDCFRLAVATDVNFKIAWFNMALIFKKTGDFNYAKRAVSKALEIDPDYEAAQVLKEEILLKSKVLDGRRN